MKINEISTKSIAIAALVVASLTLISSNIYLASSDSNEISGCVNKKSGVLRISQKCTNLEKVITWSKTGPQGAPGVKGDMGIQGPPGPVGPMGPTGPAGNNTTTTVVQTVSQKAYDSANNLIGTVLGVTDQSLTVSANGATISYSTSTGGIVTNAEIVYLNADCTGDKYHYAGSGAISFSDSAPGIASIWDNALGRAVAGSYFFGKSEGANIDRPLTLYVQEANNGVLSCTGFTVSNTSDSYTINNKLKKIVSIGRTFTTSFTTPFTYRTN